MFVQLLQTACVLGAAIILRNMSVICASQAPWLTHKQNQEPGRAAL